MSHVATVHNVTTAPRRLRKIHTCIALAVSCLAPPTLAFAQLPTDTITEFTKEPLSHLQPKIVGEVINDVRDVKETIKMENLAKGFPLLAKSDQEASPWAGAPTVPAGCDTLPTDDQRISSPSECTECFRKAQARLDDVRRRLEFVQRVYLSGEEFFKLLIAAADANSQLNGFAFAATMRGRQDLLDQRQRIRVSYDGGYQRLMTQLKAALDDIADCENEAFGNQDWYNRYGFILYEAFATHYRRSE